MGLFGKLAKLTMDVVTTPIAVVKDTFTLGGAVTEEESAVKQKLEQLAEDWGELRDECDE